MLYPCEILWPQIKKIARVGTFYVAVIRGESCFEKNAFEDTENPTRHQNSTSIERINVSREIFEISKKKFLLF